MPIVFIALLAVAPVPVHKVSGPSLDNFTVARCSASEAAAGTNTDVDVELCGDDRAHVEERAPPEWLKTAKAPFVTTRGRLAEALRDESVSMVFIGTIEDEGAFVGAPPRGHHGVLTRCTIRVHHVFKDADPALKTGRTVDVLYRNGSLKPGRARVTSLELSQAEPRCLPFDYGVFALRYVDGVLVPVPSATVSMLASGEEWQWHPLMTTLEELAPVLVRNATKAE